MGLVRRGWWVWAGMWLVVGAGFGQGGVAVQTLKVRAELYQVPVLIVDHKTHVPVANMTAERVELRVNGGAMFHPLYMTQRPDAPLSIAVLFDVSGSQVGLISAFREDLAAWAGKALRPGDEIEFYTFGVKVYRASGFVDGSAEKVAGALEVMKTAKGEEVDPHGKFAKGGTRLWDAMDAALGDLEQRKGLGVVLALTDGGDNGSGHNWGGVVERANAHGMAVFGLKYHSVVNALAGWPEFLMGGAFDHRLENVCEEAGGLVLSAKASTRLETLDKFVQMLRARYLLEFAPVAGVAKGKLTVDLVDRRLESLPGEVGLVERMASVR